MPDNLQTAATTPEPAAATTAAAPGATAANPVNWTKQQVQDFASQVAAQLHYEPGGNLQEIIEKLGGKIEHTDWVSVRETGSVEVRGKGDFTIYLSPYSGQRRARFTMAHELGHYILHSKFGEIPLTIGRDGAENRIEWEANWFAAGFLMPETDFKTQVERELSDAELAEYFDVSEAAVKIRREALGC